MKICSVCKEENERLWNKNPPLCKKCYKPPKKKCSICGDTKKLATKLSCYKCYRKSRKILCEICNKYGRFEISRNGKKVCSNCYKNFYQPKRLCKSCGKQKLAHKRYKDGTFLCQKCHGWKKRICGVCNKSDRIAKIENNKLICIKCYKTPVEKCFKCNNLSNVIKRIKDKPICIDCYLPPKDNCFECKRYTIIAKRNKNKDPLCDRCNKDICSECKRYRRIYLRKNNKVLCRNCYSKYRRANDPYYDLICCVRAGFRSAVIRAGKTKKEIKSIYNINYYKIADYLGIKPNSDYHIDHIFPIYAFNLNNIKHIKACFAPENHQWLKAEDNLKKGNKYNKEDFKNYLKKFGIEDD